MRSTSAIYSELELPYGVSLRKANLDDIPLLEHWEAVYFGLDRFSRKQLKYLLTRPNVVTWLVEQFGVPVGTATVVLRRSSPVARLYSIVTELTSRGQGFGSLLMDACERYATAHGYSRMALEVRVDNDSAIRLYEHRGYRQVCRLPMYYADGTDGVRMVRPLIRPRRQSTSSPSDPSNSPD